MILTAKAMLDRYDANPENVMNQGIIDWCEKDGIAPFGYQALFAAGVKACGGIMKRLHQADTAERCQRTYRAVQQAYQRRTLSKSAASIAVYAGMADASETCREVLLKRPLNGLSTFHADFILSALSRGGCHAEAMELLRAYYGAMLNLGSTTFWEHFELSWTKNAGRIDELPAPGEKDIHKSCGRLCFKGLRNSLCHGWSAGPAAWMTENILGLSPESLSRGSRKIICNPRESGLEWVRGSCPTPFGIVSAEIENGKIMSLKVNR